MKRSLSTILVFLIFLFSISSALADGGSISGKVRYKNSDSTFLSYSRVILWDYLNNKIDSTYSNSEGYYTFSGLTNGDYHVTAKPVHPWGGVNSTDAMLTMQHFAQMITLKGLYLKAANVNGDSRVTTMDALIIAKRFAHILNYFPVGDWLSENLTINIVSNESHNITIHVICSGDVNGSYFPVNSALPCPGLESFVYGGQNYNTVQIGSQCWMKGNLNIGTFILSNNTGDSHSDQANNGIIEKYCYENIESNCEIYGGLYEWNEAMQYVTTSGTRGICPTGWHIPTNTEFCTMLTLLDPAVDCNYQGFSGTNAGGKLKETGTIHWSTPNTGATNSSGFTALGSGYRHYYGFIEYGQLYGYFWTSTQINSTSAWDQAVSYDLSTVYGHNVPKEDGFSVRCIKDNCGPSPSQSDAGPDQTIVGTTTNLAANTPQYGTGVWNIVSGTGGTVAETHNPTSVFDGVAGTVYTLTWTISTNCESSMDTVIITFNNPPMGTPCPGIPSFVYGGQTYNTVQIGTQCWMKENLNIGTYIISNNTGSSHSDQTNNGIIEKYCYENIESNCEIYGGLYEWNEAMQYVTTIGTQGICPTGWHIPSNTEFCTMLTLLDPTVDCSYQGFSGTDAGGMLKETGFIHWSTPNTGATNSYGFTALGSGYRHYNGFIEYGQLYGYFWTSTQINSTSAWDQAVSYNLSTVYGHNVPKADGFSLRCIKD